jgi:hypothetical protein
MLLFKRYSVIFFLVAIFLSGCYEYIDVYEEADKSLFYSNGSVKFKNFQNDYILNLEAHPYTCEYGSPSEIRQAYHTYKRIYPQICGQQVRRSDDQTTIIDHSISVRSDGNYLNGYEKALVFFERDVFLVDPLPESDSAEMVNLGMNGVLYSDVYVLYPDTTVNSGEIKQLFFHPDFGILRILDINDNTWERIIE